MRLIALSIVLASFMASSAKAQTCDGTTDAGANPYVVESSTNNGYAGAVLESFSPVHTQLDFYVRATGTNVDQTVYITERSTDEAADAVMGVRLASDGTIKFLDTLLGTQDWGCWDAAGTPIACQAYTANTWYRIALDNDGLSWMYSAESAECDGADTLTQYATRINANHLNATTGTRNTPRYFRLHTGSAGGVTLELANMTWAALEDYKRNCSVDSCIGPMQCSSLGQTYTPCSTFSPAFCGNQTFAAIEIGPWEKLADWLAGSRAYAITNGRAGADYYGSGTQQYWRSPPSSTPSAIGGGVVVGPHTWLTAAHTIISASDAANPDGLSFGYRSDSADPDTFFTGIKLRFDHVDTAQQSYAHRCTALKVDANSPSAQDFALCYTADTLPEPYVSQIYDEATESGLCDDVISQGLYSNWGECQMEVDHYSISGARALFHGLCRNPDNAYFQAGDSGGPTYAIGNWDGTGIYPKLAGVTGTRIGWNAFEAINNAEAQSWFTANIDEPQGTLLPDIGFGISIEDAKLPFIGAPVDLDVADAYVDCHVTPSATLNPVEYVFCLFENQTSGQIAGCADDTPISGEYRCEAYIPRLSGEEWWLKEIVVQTTAGDRATASRYDLSKFGMMGTAPLMHIDAGATTVTPDITKPAFTTARTAAPKTVAPGGELECTYFATDTGGIRYSGCEYDMNGAPLACIGPTDNYGTFVQYCMTDVPGTATPGDTWTMTKLFAQDNQYQSTQVARSDTFTVYDCAEAVAADTVTNAWLGDQDETAGVGIKGGYAVVYEFWVKPTVNNAEAKVLLSENAIAADADADLGVRFDASGFVQALDNGIWTSDTAFPYTGGTWYHVRVKGRDITEPVPSPVEPRYDVQIAACGNPFTQIITDAVAGNGTRFYTGIAHWNMFAGAGQTLDLNNMAWTSAYCLATQCFFESPAWDCGTNIPNGCGGVIASCGVGAGACPTPGDTCGGGGTPYVCGQ